MSFFGACSVQFLFNFSNFFAIYNLFDFNKKIFSCAHLGIFEVFSGIHCHICIWLQGLMDRELFVTFHEISIASGDTVMTDVKILT